MLCVVVMRGSNRPGLLFPVVCHRDTKFLHRGGGRTRHRHIVSLAFYSCRCILVTAFCVHAKGLPIDKLEGYIACSIISVHAYVSGVIFFATSAME